MDTVDIIRQNTQKLNATKTTHNTDTYNQNIKF